MLIYQQMMIIQIIHGNKENEGHRLNDKDYYFKGQEDDDDFEKLAVEEFDLALKNFITRNK